MKEVGKSTLLGKTLTFVGFAFDDHPLDPSLKIQLTVYKLNAKAHVLCLSETRHPETELTREELGGEVLGDDIAPFAVRLMEGLPTTEMRQLLTESKPKATFYWA
jgi:hypothetical protein